MTDLGATIAPKSDQLNADDLIAEPRTVRITKVSACPGSNEQPIAIYFEGDNGKPYKPCKSMRRVLVQVWGRAGAEYVGRDMTLFRDPMVMFGGVAVGGIRISHMSHIDAPVTLALTANRASRKPYTVQPLASAPTQRVSGATVRAPREKGALSLSERADAFEEALKGKNTLAGLAQAWKAGEQLRDELQKSDPVRAAALAEVRSSRARELGGE